MLDRIEEIDTSAIEELARIKRDQEVLEGRLGLMQDRRDGVSEVVFERVRADYRRRHEALEDEARPLKEAARAEFAKLQALLSEIRQGRDDARLAKEELEFRNALGEFADEQFDQAARAAAERLDQRESDLAAVEALRERFFAAVRSQDELEAPHVLPPPVVPHAAAADVEGAPGMPAQPVPIAEAEASPEPVDDGTEVEGSRYAPQLPPAGEGEPLGPSRFGDALRPASSQLAPAGDEQPLAAAADGAFGDEGDEPDAAPPTERTRVDAVGDVHADGDGVGDVELARGGAEPGEGAMDFGATSLLDPTGDVARDAMAAAAAPAPGHDEDEWHEAPTGSFDTPLLPPPPPPPPGPAPGDEELGGATRILSRPRLVESGNGGGPREHLLALGRTSIGRASDNLVHLLDEAVSRHHAEIVPGPSGFLIRDLGSENGIYVNGARTPEHVLKGGDVIQIGARTLVYHDA